MADTPKIAPGLHAVMVREVDGIAGDIGEDEKDNCWINLRRLRPLPPALSAEDEAVLRRALTSIRDINCGPDQASASWRVQEAAAIAKEALARVPVRRARPAPPAADVPQDSAWQPATPTAPDLAALERAGLDALLAWRKKEPVKFFLAHNIALADAADALLAATAPPPDPVGEAWAALEALDDELMTAPGPLMDRMRRAIAALAALPGARG